MSNVGSQVNYRGLLDRHTSIRIPLIQRDYAQGRPSAKQVRDEFLGAIENALKLPPNDPSLPMNLDFIYGSVAPTDEHSRFEPLDGQQRLTTLFLLHWYLAWNDGRFSDFMGLFLDGESSRFAYSVRQSSNEFFNTLVSYEPELQPAEIGSLSSFLVNQAWYFRSWNLDPTIQSVLSMLDAIHRRFAGSEGLFERLIDIETPAITFQLLPLENFGLSDDLYIKMNARGKPLTPFETFKARYEQELASQFEGQTREIDRQEFPIHEFVSRRLDTAWLDLFWSKNHASAVETDESVFNLFRLIALVTRDPDSERCLEDVATLAQASPTYSAFHDSGWLDEDFTQTLIPLLEQWSSPGDGVTTILPNNNYFDEHDAFAKLIVSSTNLVVSEILLFMAYVCFIREYEGSIDPNKANQWLRVIHNLVINSNIDRVDRLPMGMGVIQTLLPYADNILSNLASLTVPDTFPTNVKHQAEEEILKAQLLLANDGWRALIERAELHRYFQGQIEFLLDFSGIVAESRSTDVADWDTSKHVAMQAAFETCLKKAEAMFDAKGLTDLENHLWARALLVVGDYLLEAGGRNKSLLVNSATDQASWKRLLRGFSGTERSARSYLRDLWAKLDEGVPYKAQLKTIISRAGLDVDKWRRTMATTPQVWTYGHSRMVRFADNTNIYLLYRTQMNGAHVELYGYSFYLKELKGMEENGQLTPLEVSHYQDVSSSDVEPYFILNYPDKDGPVTVEVDYENGKYRVWALSKALSELPKLMNAFEKLGELEVAGDYLRVEVAPSRLKKILAGLASDLKE